MSANRYADLVKSVIGGSFYESKGIVVPFRYGNTEIRLETDTPNNEFGLYLNEVFSGTVISDVIGNVVFSRPLPRGEVEIVLLNNVTGRRQSSWLTVREYALWMAAYATTLELIDDNIQTVRDDMAITTVTATGVEDCFGQYVGYYNDLGLSLSAYRDTLHELRLAYRNYGGQYAGFQKAVSTICQVEPFGYSRRLWGPNWILDRSFVTNHRYKERSHTVEKATNNITGVSVVSVEADVFAGTPAGHIDYSNVTGLLMWSPLGVPGLPVLAAEGELFLPGPPSTWPAYLVGDIAEPFTVVVGTNDYIYLTIDENIGGGYIAVQLVTGLPAPTAANVAADINAALVADPRFGAPYAAFAFSHFYAASNRLAMVSPVAAGSSIRIENGLTNAATATMGIVEGTLVAMPDLLQGVTYVSATGVIDINAGNAQIDHVYNGATLVHQLRWNSPGVGLGALVTLVDPGEYSLIDAGGAILKVYASPDDMEALIAPWPHTDSFTFSLTYHRVSENLAQTQGLNVLVDMSLLPAAVVADNVNVVDDSVLHYQHPDNWFIDETAAPVLVTYMSEGSVITDKLDDYDPSSSYAWWCSTDKDAMTVYTKVQKFPTPWPNTRGSDSPQKSFGGLYDYSGFNMIVSGWVRNFISPGGTATIKVSWDGGITYYSAAPVLLALDSLGIGRPTFVSGTFRISDEIKPNPMMDRDVIIAIDFACAFANMTYVLEAFTVDVEFISSRYLTNATVARSRHRQYFGELQYVWAIDEMELRHKQYLGLPHKISDKTTPYAGVTISVISADMLAGTGILTYSYNSVGDVRMLKWDSPDSTPWGPGLGYVSIISTGSYTLYGTDGSYLFVNVTREALPILAGTPPAAETVKNVVISDTSVYQGLVREISPAHIALDIFDVSEYTALGVAKNLLGAVTEADFAASTLVNLTIQPADPFMMSYVFPSALPVTGEVLTINSVTLRAPLALASDQDTHEACLFMDSLPVPNTTVLGVPNWWFNNSQEVEIDPSIWSSSSTYSIDYNLLYRITTIPFTTNPYELDYVWLADYTLFDRKDTIEGEYLNTVPVFFNADTGQAFLDRKSTMDKSVAKLYMQDTREQREIAQRYWRFLSSSVVEIDSSQLVTGAQFFLTHEESRSYEVSHLDVGLRTVPNVLDLIPGVEVTYVSGTALGTEASLECVVTFGPVYNFRLISSLGNEGAIVPVVLSGSYIVFDSLGNYLEIDVDVPSLPVVLGTYKQNLMIKQGVKFEWRCGIDEGHCLAAEWKEIEKNENVHSVDSAGVLFPIQQLRLTLGGIRDVLDFRVRSLVLKGLHLHGTPSVQGLTNVWG
jgi:hypothetical protein